MAMGYNACKKSGPMAEKLEYMLAIELLSVYEVQQFVDPDVSRAPATAAGRSSATATAPSTSPARHSSWPGSAKRFRPAKAVLLSCLPALSVSWGWIVLLRSLFRKSEFCR